jgi:hypothetical protein
LKNQTQPPHASGQTSGLSWVRKFAYPVREACRLTANS